MVYIIGGLRKHIMLCFPQNILLHIPTYVGNGNNKGHVREQYFSTSEGCDTDIEKHTVT